MKNLRKTRSTTAVHDRCLPYRNNRSIVILSRDTVLARNLEAALSGEGFHVGAVVDFAALRKTIDGVVILDVSLPGDFRLCRHLHEEHFVPILVLTNGGEEDGTKAFQSDAEDCMTKPVNIAELTARLRKIMAHHDLEDNSRVGDGLITIGDLSIDPLRYQVKLGQKEIKLTAKEFNLLLLLASRKGRMVSRDEIIKRLWGASYTEKDTVIDVHVCRIRRKIESMSHWPQHLVPVRGIGYKLQQ